MQLEPLGSSLKVEPRGNGTSTIHSSAMILTLSSPKNQQTKGFLLPFPTPFLSAEPGGAGTPDVTRLVLLCFSRPAKGLGKPPSPTGLLSIPKLLSALDKRPAAQDGPGRSELLIHRVLLPVPDLLGEKAGHPGESYP